MFCLHSFSLRRLKYLIIDGKRKDESLFNTNQLDLPGRRSRRLFEIIPTKCSLIQLGPLRRLNERLQTILFDKYQFIVLATSNSENNTNTDSIIIIIIIMTMKIIRILITFCLQNGNQSHITRDINTC